MIGRITHKLKEFKSKSDVNQDFYTKVEFSGEQMLLPPGEINHIVDVGEQFNKERRESTIYRLKGTVTPLFSNVLMNLDTVSAPTGDFGTSNINTTGNGLDVFDNTLFKRDPLNNDFVGTPTLTFEEAYNSHLSENDGWFGFFEPDITKIGICTYYDIEPTRERFDLSSYKQKNWEITITYPSRKDDTHMIVQNGLLVIGSVSVEVGGVPMVAIATSTYHGLSNGDRVVLSNMPNTAYNGEFTVVRRGLDNGDLKDNYFVISLDPTTVTIGDFTGRMKRMVNGQESEYYLRVFKKLLQTDGDYEMYQLAFSNNVFNDPNYQFIINEDIDIDGLVDNLGRPLSELYLTMIKTNSGGMFHKTQSGLDLEFIGGNINNDLSNIRQITYDTNTSKTPLENNIMLINNEYYGDVVEYNKFELREKILSDVLHRFNTTNREITNSNNIVSGPRREGYLYKPHHLIKIREFSLYIEQGDTNTIGIPNYAEDLGDGRWLWRDLLDIGVYDGEGDFLDYPFTNGVHYIHQNFCFKTMRQDPFKSYGLYHSGSVLGANVFDPADPIGDLITDRFIVKRSDNVC
jgi:hypothetical protein